MHILAANGIIFKRRDDTGAEIRLVPLTSSETLDLMRSDWDGDLRDALIAKSYPIRLHWRLQLWRSRAGFDTPGRVNEWDVVIRREPLLELNPADAAVAGMKDGSVQARVSLRKETGAGPHKRQTSPHAHGVAVDPSGRYALVADLGLDRLFQADEEDGSL